MCPETVGPPRHQPANHDDPQEGHASTEGVAEAIESVEDVGFLQEHEAGRHGQEVVGEEPDEAAAMTEAQDQRHGRERSHTEHQSDDQRREAHGAVDLAETNRCAGQAGGAQDPLPDDQGNQPAWPLHAFLRSSDGDRVETRSPSARCQPEKAPAVSLQMLAAKSSIARSPVTTALTAVSMTAT